MIHLSTGRKQKRERRTPLWTTIGLKTNQFVIARIDSKKEKLLAKGPSFCPVPTNINWQKTHEDLEKFERRIRLATYFHNKNDKKKEDQEVEKSLPPVPSKSKWEPPKSIYSEVELLLSKVRKDVFEPW